MNGNASFIIQKTLLKEGLECGFYSLFQPEFYVLKEALQLDSIAYGDWKA